MDCGGRSCADFDTHVGEQLGKSEAQREKAGLERLTWQRPQGPRKEGMGEPQRH